MNKLRSMLLIFAMGLAMNLLVGCGGADTPNADVDAQQTAGDTDSQLGSDANAEQVGVAITTRTLVGRWDLLSQDGNYLRAGELYYTYRADGTGVATEGNSTKDYTWVYDPTAATLTVLTENEDMVFAASLEGDTLTLNLDDPPMILKMRRADDSGGNGE